MGSDKHQKTALIVDDEIINRKILGSILKKEGYLCFFAVNGKEAVALFQQESFDLVLMDIMMPVMDGYEATKQIKALEKDVFIPVIFLTAMTDEEALSRCVESGGDDFLTKPYNSTLLHAKISAMERFRLLYVELSEQKKSLELYQVEIQHELEFAEHIFQNITSRATIDLPYLKFWASTMSQSLFSGDLLLTARKPAGGLHVLLCDFTGHGLPAAVGALPVSEIFIAMTNRGFELANIVTEINKKLNRELPTGFFCAATFIDIDATTHTIQIWNAGLPDIVLFGSNENESYRIPSTHLALGITNQEIGNKEVVVYPITNNQVLFMYTDGLVEVVNDEDEMYGCERLERCFLESKSSDLMENIKQSVMLFRGDANQHDDITCVQLNCFEAVSDLNPDQIETQKTASKRMVAAEWGTTLDFTAEMLKETSPIPMLMNTLSNILFIDEFKQKIFTILSELYSNALDHGLLGLKSEYKSTSEGFVGYYKERERRLANLKEGRIKISLEQIKCNDDYVLKIKVMHTGEGFDFNKITSLPVHQDKFVPSGRGIKLVNSLCSKVEYSDEGRTVEAIFTLPSKT
ncbi:Serine phosphatase RsbU, regulator of sigma subunit [hydrothermal vent metagenome]|uniref:Serine phosphatase RsbU, regulator of sigma subunit n=1 Tax=hydrothermal vent metagenome TaxID=652676 RepID=A0A3B0ZDM7_9ZZZZ